ncbi:MAG TPA: SMP-30/gluconolactonase/LRE family protein [Stellaceae bacterium]|nr:SMP-30/gluconolactonase/LRE family protein [Stellaceae bacterium]
MRELTVLLDGLAFGEGPRWRDGELFFSDMHAHKIMALDLCGAVRDVATVPGQPSGLGWLPDGRLLAVSMMDRRIVRLEADGALPVHAELGALATGPCNDMVVDALGRAYVGNMGFDPYANETPRTADLILVRPDGSAAVAARDLAFPNGAAISPDGATLIVAETGANRLTAFTIARDGALAERRIWAELGAAVPDGIALDAEGAAWIASPITGEVLRIFAGGRVAERFATSQKPFACALGGPDRKTLFVLTAESWDPETCRTHRTARIGTTPVEVRGAGLP